MSEVDQLSNHMLGVGPRSNQSGASEELGGALTQINELNGPVLSKGWGLFPRSQIQENLFWVWDKERAGPWTALHVYCAGRP